MSVQYLGPDDRKELIDLARNAWSIAICAMQGMSIPADWGNSVGQGLRKYGIDVDSLPFVAHESGSGTCTVTRDLNCSNCGKRIGFVRNCEMYETCDGRQAWKSLDHEVCDVPNYCPNCGRKVVNKP